MKHELLDLTKHPLNDSEQAIIGIFDQLQVICYGNARDKGFWNDQDAIIKLIMRDATEDDRTPMLKAVNDAFHAMKGDLMHSELGERTEAQRKNLPSDKIEGFTGEEEEQADVVIRMLDYCGRRHFRLGLAIVMKMRYNFGRPYMHGKQF